MAPASTHVALLRGINVGGHNRLPMKTLTGIFEELGCVDVRTYIQSGNVVYAAPRSLAAEIPRVVGQALRDQLGIDVPLVTRSARELARLIADNPFLADGVDPAYLHCGFLGARPSAAGLAKLDPERSAPDAFVVGKKEVYLHCPDGMARTKLTSSYFETRLGSTITVRNWRTTARLLEMAAG